MNLSGWGRSAIFILMTVAYLGCGGASSSDEPTAPARAATLTPRNDPAAAAVPADSAPTPVAPPTDSGVTAGVNEAVKGPALISRGTRQEDLKTFQIPDSLRSRMDSSDPGLLPKADSAAFNISNEHLKIDAKDSTVTFTGSLHIQGKQDESIELRCQITKSEAVWSCRDMFPVDEKVAAEQRLQGTFICIDTYVCNFAGVDIYVVINGKTQEPQHFQMQSFKVHVARSGDEEAPAPASAKPNLPSPPPPTTKERLRVQEKASAKAQGKFTNRVLPDDEDPAPETRVATGRSQASPDPEQSVASQDDDGSGDDQEPELSGPQLEQALKIPDASFEYDEPIRPPSPSGGAHAIRGIEVLHPDLSGNAPIQAQGYHNRGKLTRAAELPASGPGYISRDHGRKDYATDLTVMMLARSLGAMNRQFPRRPPVVIASIANANGGRLRRQSRGFHASHQTGLDMDVGLPSNASHTDIWPACTTEYGPGPLGNMETHCRSGGKIADDLDDARLWYFLKQMTCAKGNPVIAMFLDREIKGHMCRYVRQHTVEDAKVMNNPDSCAFRALRALRHSGGHFDHVHVRLRCPENRACKNRGVTLANGNGC